MCATQYTFTYFILHILLSCTSRYSAHYGINCSSYYHLLYKYTTYCILLIQVTVHHRALDETPETDRDPDRDEEEGAPPLRNVGVMSLEVRKGSM